MCNICGVIDPPQTVELPIKRPDGSPITVACKSCAEKSSAYCCLHNHEHFGYVDGTTACYDCVNELLHSNISRADSIHDQILSTLEPNDLETLAKWANNMRAMTHESLPVTTLRYVCTKALRSKLTIDDVLAQFDRIRSLNYILGR